MTTAVGLDLSLTSSGLARITWDGETRIVDTHRVGRPGVTTMRLLDRYRAIAGLARDIREWAAPADLVVLEGLSLDSRSTSGTERAHLWWRVAGELLDHGCPLVVVTPTQLKKWATGRGVGSKMVVGIAAGRMWPDVEIRDDNEADALVLATIGGQLLDGPLPCEVTAYRREVAGKLSVVSPSAA